MVVFDITNAESFAKAKNWVKELQRQGNPNMIMALAGNKADLAAQRAVTSEDAKVCLHHAAAVRSLHHADDSRPSSLLYLHTSLSQGSGSGQELTMKGSTEGAEPDAWD